MEEHSLLNFERKKHTFWLKRAQFALQGMARKSVYKISFENLLGCEMWFNLQQRNWQLGVTASAGSMPCDKSLGLNKTTSPPCHFSTNRNLTSGQHNTVGHVQMYSTCSVNANILYYRTDFMDFVLTSRKKTKKNPTYTHIPTLLTQRKTKCVLPSSSAWRDYKPSPMHCIEVAVSLLFMVRQTFSSVLRFKNSKSRNNYFW